MTEINFEDCLYFASGRTNRLIAKIGDERFKKLGIAPSAGFILMCLSNQPASQPSDIAKQLSLDRSTVTRFLDKLERQGYIKRQSDGRQVHITTTAAGQGLQQQINQTWSELNSTYAKILGTKNEEQLRMNLNQQFTAFQA